MIPEGDPAPVLEQEARSRYIAFLDLAFKMLRLFGSDEQLVLVHEKVVAFVKSKQLDVYPDQKNSKPGSAKPRIVLPSEEQIIRLTHYEIRALVMDQNSSRKLLAHIAKVRYRLPVGELSRLKNKDLLKDRLLVLLDNRETQENLARFASKDKETR